MTEVISFLFDTNTGRALLVSALTGLGVLVKLGFEWFLKSGDRNVRIEGQYLANEKSEKDQLRSDIDYLRREVENLRLRVGDLEHKLIESSAAYYALYNHYVRLRSKYDAVLGAVVQEGSDKTREVVDRVLRLYGSSLDSFDPEAPFQVQVEDIFKPVNDD